MFNKILVICTGNICRSPFGERLLQQQHPDKVVHSAGISALVGHEADAMAVQVAKQMGVSLAGHKGQQLTVELCQAYDLILAMEQYHLNYIADLSPTSTGKAMLYGHWLTDKAIVDPYRQGEAYFQRIFSKIEQAATAWQDRL